MQTCKILRTIETHTFGEPTRIINGGLLPLKGNTMYEKRDYMREHFDYIRTALIQEPRGHRDMFGALLTQPTMPEADFGVIYMDNTNYLNMCGHATIGVSTAIVETGIVEAVYPETVLKLETPAGLVESHVHVAPNGSVESVSFRNVPGFLHYKDLDITVPELGDIKVDIAFGGNYFAYVESSLLGIPVLDIKYSKKLKYYGALIKEAVNKRIKVVHPEKPYIDKLDIVTIYSPPTLPGATLKNVHIFSDAQIDRSPGGTGTTAWLAKKVGKGEMSIGDSIVIEGFVGGTFTGVPLAEVKVGEFDGVLTEVTGSAHICGYQQIVIDPDDPFKYGFIID